MESLPGWLGDLLDTYVLPYWGWILAAILGVIVLRMVVRRVIGRVVGLIVAAVLLGGGVTTGASTWLSDRGWNLPSFNIF